MRDYVLIFVSAMLVQNFTLVMFLGLCAFFGVTSKVSVAVRLGLADTFVLVMTSIVVSILNRWVVGQVPYLRTIAFIVVIASMVQVTEMAIKKWSPVLFRELGIYLPLITTNCAILALAIFQTNRGYGFLEGLTDRRNKVCETSPIQFHPCAGSDVRPMGAVGREQFGVILVIHGSPGKHPHAAAERCVGIAFHHEPPGLNEQSCSDAFRREQLAHCRLIISKSNIARLSVCVDLFKPAARFILVLVAAK